MLIFNLLPDQYSIFELFFKFLFRLSYEILCEKDLARVLVPELDYWLFERQKVYLLSTLGVLHAAINYNRLRLVNIVSNCGNTNEEDKPWDKHKKHVKEIVQQTKNAKELQYFCIVIGIIASVTMFSFALQFNSDFYLTTVDTFTNIINFENPLADYNYDLVDDEFSEVSLQDEDDYDLALELDTYGSDSDDPIL